jgi:shikimate kinase
LHSSIFNSGLSGEEILNAEPGTHNNLFLIGYRCTGKSSVGKLLAGILGWPFIDTDSLLVSESGSSVKEIVADQGWEGFRKIEHDILKQVCLTDRQVVATGGGIVLSDANVNRMKKTGKLIWLKAKTETIEKRMIQDQATEAFRPALTSKDNLAEIEETLIEREPYYQRAMDFYVETDGRQIADICDMIIRHFR